MELERKMFIHTISLFALATVFLNIHRTETMERPPFDSRIKKNFFDIKVRIVFLSCEGFHPMGYGNQWVNGYQWDTYNTQFPGRLFSPSDVKNCPTTFYCIFLLLWVPMTTTQNIRVCFLSSNNTLFS